MKQMQLQMLKCINEDVAKLRIIVKILETLIKQKISKQKHGRKRYKLDNTIVAIMYYLRTGCTWRALPAVFGKWKTIYGWFVRIVKLEIFETLFIKLNKLLIAKGKIQLKRILTDGSLTCFFGGGSYAKINPRNRNKRTINRMLATDEASYPLALLLAPGTSNDSPLFIPIVEKIDQTFGLPSAFNIHADKGFDSFENRMYIRSKNGMPHIPYRNHGFAKGVYQKSKDKHRPFVEHSIAWINRYKSLSNIFVRSIDRIFQLFHLAFVLINSKLATLKDLNLLIPSI